MGDKRAICHLGECYFHKQNFKEAVAKYREAATKGDDRALYYLGVCYLNGKGVDIDKDMAVQCLEKATEKGNPRARDLLRRIFQ